jgi:hypothetical protein
MSEKFPTWNGHLPQRPFYGLRPIQVWTKTVEKFPTWRRGYHKEWRIIKKLYLTSRGLKERGSRGVAAAAEGLGGHAVAAEGLGGRADKAPKKTD